jgi:hypothetical protein
MARKKTKKTTRRRSSRRGMGATKFNTSELLTQIGGVVAGVAAAGYANKLLFANVSDPAKKETYSMITPLALGVALPMLSKNKFAQYAGLGAIALAGTKFLTKQGVIGAAEDEMSISISGDDLSVVAGDSDFAMAGDSDFAMAGEGEDSGISVLAGTDTEEYAAMEADEQYYTDLM